MLFPYMNEPATGSRIPSISTGGAAINAMMKQVAATSRVGIMMTPNHPTYNLLFVDVTQSQNTFHELLLCVRVEVIFFNRAIVELVR